VHLPLAPKTPLPPIAIDDHQLASARNLNTGVEECLQQSQQTLAQTLQGLQAHVCAIFFV
jgi:hypothetical protein